MREIVAMLQWLTPLRFFVFYVSLPNKIKLLLFNIFFFGKKAFHLMQNIFGILLSFHDLCWPGAIDAIQSVA